MFNEFFREEDGWVSVSGVFWVSMILAAGGIAVDTSNLYFAKNRLAAATDAAVLAAAGDLPDVETARATALEYIQKNMPVERFGTIASEVDVELGTWDAANRSFNTEATVPNAVRLVAHHSSDEGYDSEVNQLILGLFGLGDWNMARSSVAVYSSGCVASAPLGALSDYLFFFEDATIDGNWQGATKGFVGDVAVNGLTASERTSGGVPYLGTIYTNDDNIGMWQDIVDQNPATASSVTGEIDRINSLQVDLLGAMDMIDAMTPTPGYESMSSKDLDGLNTQDGTAQTFVINITSDLSNNKPINVTGDADDLFILRWDEDPDMPGYQGQVKLSGGSGVNPLGDLKPTNFINTAGDLNASGGGSNPSGLQQYLNELPDDANGGGFFTGYWLTTGKPGSNESSSLSNGIFVGGWYTTATKFSMTSGTSGVYVAPPEIPFFSGCTANEMVAGSILVE